MAKKFIISYYVRYLKQFSYGFAEKKKEILNAYISFSLFKFKCIYTNF